MARPDGRAPYQIRPLAITRNYLDFAEGSAFVEWGRTRVLCSASIDERVPGWLVGAGQGWLTAEYGMLPKSTKERVQRPAPGGRANGRSLEIQRLIGRALRAVVDLKAVGERTIWIDCDVIQADGGTRTAAVTGAMVALHDALSLLKEGGVLDKWPLHGLVAATSVGLCNGVPVVDLCYEEDRDASVDMNVVMTADGRFIEIQGTAEGDPFTHEQHLALLDLAKRGIDAVLTVQKKTLGLA